MKMLMWIAILFVCILAAALAVYLWTRLRVPSHVIVAEGDEYNSSIDDLWATSIGKYSINLIQMRTQMELLILSTACESYTEFVNKVNQPTNNSEDITHRASSDTTDDGKLIGNRNHANSLNYKLWVAMGGDFTDQEKVYEDEYTQRIEENRDLVSLFPDEQDVVLTEEEIFKLKTMSVEKRTEWDTQIKNFALNPKFVEDIYSLGIQLFRLKQLIDAITQKHASVKESFSVLEKNKNYTRIQAEFLYNYVHVKKAVQEHAVLTQDDIAFILSLSQFSEQNLENIATYTMTDWRNLKKALAGETIVSPYFFTSHAIMSLTKIFSQTGDTYNTLINYTADSPHRAVEIVRILQTSADEETITKKILELLQHYSTTNKPYRGYKKSGTISAPHTYMTRAIKKKHTNTALDGVLGNPDLRKVVMGYTNPFEPSNRVSSEFRETTVELARALPNFNECKQSVDQIMRQKVGVAVRNHDFTLNLTSLLEDVRETINTVDCFPTMCTWMIAHKERLVNLTSLTMKNMIRILSDDAHMQEFAAVIRSGALTYIQLLDLTHNQIGDVGMEAFSLEVSRGALSNLKTLFLFNNNIGDAGMIAFSDALKPTSTLPMGALASLKILYLNYNQIGDGGMKAFSAALSSGALASLNKLSLGGNQIGDSGMIAFADAIKPTDEILMGSLASLELLYLDSNQIGDEGMKALSGALSSGSLANLTKLAFSNNSIGDAGMIAFSDALKPDSNSTRRGALQELTSLNFMENAFTPLGLNAFSMALANQQNVLVSLRTLWVDDAMRVHQALLQECNARELDLQ